jgi:hypothetical protein
MASIQTRNSVLAIKKETSEGVPAKPSAATDYVALQDDFSMQGGFNLLDNAELKASIGTAKSIIGGEAPSASLSHYLRASGVEGQAPNYSLLLEACLGATSVAATEYDTIAGSTAAALKVGAGEGAQFERGEAVLIKDAANGYRIRCVDSVASDDLTLSFETPVATPAAINLGKCVLYKPANDSHPTLTLWHYLGQGGALQAMAGSRVTSASFDISAGELINASYNLEGVGFYFDPMEVEAGANKIDFDIGAGTITATVPVKLYKTPIELADAVATSMSAAAGVTITCEYSSADGKFTVAKASGTLAVDWLTGTDSIGAVLGFTADDTGALSYQSDAAVDFSSPQNPSFDNADPLAAKDNEVMIGFASEFACFKASAVSMTIDTPKADIPSVCSASGIQGSIVQSRSVTITVSALLEKYDAKQFERFRQNADVKFQYSFGQKTGGNWTPGKAGCLYVPTATLSSFAVSDADGLAQLDIELKAFVNSNGDGEVYVAFV